MASFRRADARNGAIYAGKAGHRQDACRPTPLVGHRRRGGAKRLVPLLIEAISDHATPAFRQPYAAGKPSGITVPELQSAPVFYPAGTRLIWISEAGEIETIDRPTAAARLARHVPLICHRRWTEARAGTEIEACLDIMELYAFVRPARFCLPTPRGLATQLALPLPAGGEDMAALLPRAAFALLDELAAARRRHSARPAPSPR